MRIYDYTQDQLAQDTNEAAECTCYVDSGYDPNYSIPHGC